MMQGRSLAAILVLLGSSLLLLSNQFAKHKLFHLKRTDVNHASSHQSPSEILSAANLVSDKTLTVARTFGRQSRVLGFSPFHNQGYVKRALDKKWSCLVEKGRRYYVDGVLAAYDGRRPAGLPKILEKEKIYSKRLDGAGMRIASQYPPIGTLLHRRWILVPPKKVTSAISFWTRTWSSTTATANR